MTVRANVRSSSPYLHSSSSPCTLSHILEQHHNQCVPGSPSLSPYFKQIAFSQRVQLTRNGSPAAAQVPEPVENASSSTANYSNGSRVYSGSPLLRQILRGKYYIHNLFTYYVFFYVFIVIGFNYYNLVLK